MASRSSEVNEARAAGCATTPLAGTIAQRAIRKVRVLMGVLMGLAFWGSTRRPSSCRGVGARMPEGVELFWMPPGAGLNRYRYTVVNRRALVLDYQDRRVIEILEGPPERK